VNPFDLSASDLLIWGIVLHLIADWPLQNDWMARNKANPWHLAGVVHAGVHLVALTLVFGWWPSFALAVVHYLIDLRKPVAWWSRFMRQTQPEGLLTTTITGRERPLYDIGTEVRFWTDQVFHIACIAIAALVIAS
jgi:hypothetical protein